MRAAHAEGFAVVAGAIAWEGRRRPHALAAYEPGPGRIPGFGAPLLCPSVLPGIELDRLDDVAGLPAFAAPRSEPWVYDGRIVLRVRQDLELDRDPVVDAPEHDGAEDERERGRDDEIDHLGGARQAARPDRVPHGGDRRRDRIAPAQHVEQRVDGSSPCRAARPRSRGSA